MENVDAVGLLSKPVICLGNDCQVGFLTVHVSDFLLSTFLGEGDDFFYHVRLLFECTYIKDGWSKRTNQNTVFL
mgnify:CR=1 FL=1